MVAISAILSSCKDKNAQIAAVVPEVNVVQVGQQNVAVYAEYVGQAYGETDVEIKPRVEGWVQSINFKEGSLVQQGQLLCVIQDDELRDRDQAAAADLAHDDARADLAVRVVAHLSQQSGGST